jgi:hypothetical protein
MKRFALILAAFTVLAFAAPTASSATESQQPPLLAQRTTDLPKGTYQQTCQCQISGGIYLQRYCANLNARMFQTNLDVRTCPQPKEIKNCDGNLRCTEKGQECGQ